MDNLFKLMNHEMPADRLRQAGRHERTRKSYLSFVVNRITTIGSKMCVIPNNKFLLNTINFR